MPSSHLKKGFCKFPPSSCAGQLFSRQDSGATPAEPSTIVYAGPSPTVLSAAPPPPPVSPFGAVMPGINPFHTHLRNHSCPELIPGVGARCGVVSGRFSGAAA